MKKTENLDADSKRILRMIKKKLKKAAELTMREISFQIEAAYESVIEDFYNNYLPKWYDRTYSTFLASNRWDDPFYVHQDGDTIIGGIKVSSNFISGNPYRAQKGWVFHRTFDLGIHGFDRSSDFFKRQRDISAMTNFILHGRKGDWSQVTKTTTSTGSLFSYKSKLLRTADIFTRQKLSDEEIAINKEIYDFVYGDGAPQTSGFTYTKHKRREKFYKAKYTNFRVPKKSTPPKKKMDKMFSKITNKWNIDNVYKDMVNQIF